VGTDPESGAHEKGRATLTYTRRGGTDRTLGSLAGRDHTETGGEKRCSIGDLRKNNADGQYCEHGDRENGFET